MRPFDDPASLTPAERFQEIARVLALGVLRLRAATAAGAAGQPGLKNLAETGNSCLEVPANTVLSVHTG